MRAIAILGLAGLLGGCASGPLKEVGKPPTMSPVSLAEPDPFMTSSAYPQSPSKPVARNSLWNDRQSSLFTGRRTLAHGDLLTVQIAINDKAQVRNQSDRSRTADRSISLAGSYDANGVGGSASGDVDLGSKTSFEGNGATVRSETIRLSIAATVLSVLPNGNLYIRGSQEVRVNSEMRVLTIEGIVRPTDIGPDNTISYERIAEARISYGGRGRISEVQEPPYGQQIIDRLSPL